MSFDELKLPLHLFGFDQMPAVPVDLRDALDALLKLDQRHKQVEQAMQGLTLPFDIGGYRARAYAFMYGGVAADHEAALAREQARAILGGNPVAAAEALAKIVLEKGEGAFEHISAPPAAVKAKPSDGGDSSTVDLTALCLDEARQFSMSWTTFPDVATGGKEYLDAWASAIDVTQPDAATAAFWPTIAQYGLAYNLILPKKVDEGDIDDLRQAFEGSWDGALDEAFSAGALYAIDLRIYEMLEPQTVDSATRFTPATLTLLVQNPRSKNLIPELVRVSGYQGAGAQNFVRRSATAAAWVYALQAAKTSVTVYGIWLGHVYHWHIVTAAMQMTMFHCLDEDHAIRKLLDPQSNYLIGFDNALLLLWRFAAPPTSVTSSRQYLELTNQFATDRSFFDDDPDETLARLGLREEDFTTGGDAWDRYPIVGQLLDIWREAGNYVRTYVEQHWASDQEVQDDKDLQKWIKNSGKAHGGNIRGLPTMDSRAALIRVLQSLVYRVTAHGTSRLNAIANPAMTFVGNFPPCLQNANIPHPDAEFDNKILLQYLPKTGTIGDMMNFYYIFSFSTPYAPVVPLGGIEEDLYLDDPKCQLALLSLRQFVVDFIERLDPDTPQIHQWPQNIET